MATLVGSGPVGIVGEQGRSFGHSSPTVGLHSNSKATATSNEQALGLAFLAGDITNIVKIPSTASRISVFGQMYKNTTSVSANPAVYIYGIVPWNEATVRHIEGLGPTDGNSSAPSTPTIPLVGTDVDGNLIAYTAKRLDAKIGDPATVIDSTVAKCHADGTFLTTPVPDELYQLDTQGCPYIVCLVGTALASDDNTSNSIVATVV